MDFTLNGAGVGVKDSEVRSAEPGTVQVKAKVAALLEPEPTEETERVRKATLNANRPYWDLERARVGNTRTVPVEVIVNGQAVAKKEVPADGQEREVTFDVEIKQIAGCAYASSRRVTRTRSSWWLTARRSGRARSRRIGA